MPEWTLFRAIADRLGLSREDVEAVERGGVSTEIQHPIDSRIHVRVRPDPDWTQRMTDAWNGVLINSRRQSAGTISIDDGRLFVGNPNSPDRGVTVDAVAGEYEVVLTIAHLGAEETGDYEEFVSHAFALLQGDENVASIEPMRADDGSELWFEMWDTAFAGVDARDLLVAAREAGRLWSMDESLAPAASQIDQSGKSSRITNSNGTGSLVRVQAGAGRDFYPIFRIDDSDGRLVGVLVDFLYDNRPYE